VRRLLGGRREDLARAGSRARAFALAAARTPLEAGHGVVVPRLVARTAFIDRLAAVADETGARFHEVYLCDDVESVLRRFAEHTAATEPTRADAHEILSGGEVALRAAHAAITALIPLRTRRSPSGASPVTPSAPATSSWPAWRTARRDEESGRAHVSRCVGWYAVAPVLRASSASSTRPGLISADRAAARSGGKKPNSSSSSA
jgi:hypothetical protein